MTHLIREPLMLLWFGNFYQLEDDWFTSVHPAGDIHRKASMPRVA